MYRRYIAFSMFALGSAVVLGLSLTMAVQLGRFRNLSFGGKQYPVCRKCDDAALRATETP